LLGDAISPTLIGWVADLASLQLAFLLMTAMIVIGGVLWLLGMPHLERDTAAASQG
jgi:MFS transporter, Spinster family, sphingosine-1-phosphate transporter